LGEGNEKIGWWSIFSRYIEVFTSLARTLFIHSHIKCLVSELFLFFHIFLLCSISIWTVSGLFNLCWNQVLLIDSRGLRDIFQDYLVHLNVFQVLPLKFEKAILSFQLFVRKSLRDHHVIRWFAIIKYQYPFSWD